MDDGDVFVFRTTGAVPQDATRAGPGDGRKDAHERGLACAIGPQQAGQAGLERERELGERPAARGVLLADAFDDELHGEPPAMRVEACLRSCHRNGCVVL